VALRKILQRLANFGKELDGMILDRLGNPSDLLVEFWRHGNRAQALKGIDQRVGEAVQAVSVLDDAFALDIVEDFADLLGGELVMIQERNEARDGECKRRQCRSALRTRRLSARPWVEFHLRHRRTAIRRQRTRRRA